MRRSTCPLWRKVQNRFGLEFRLILGAHAVTAVENSVFGLTQVSCDGAHVGVARAWRVLGAFELLFLGLRVFSFQRI